MNANQVAAFRVAFRIVGFVTKAGKFFFETKRGVALISVLFIADCTVSMVIVSVWVEPVVEPLLTDWLMSLLPASWVK